MRTVAASDALWRSTFVSALLDGPEQRGRDRRRDGAAVPCDLDGHVDARGPHAVGELLEGVEPLGGSRRCRSIVALAQDAERGTEVRQRLAGDALDLLQRAPGALGPAVDEVGGDAGLDVDRDHRVGDDVVQFARDAQPLLADAPQGLLLARALGPLRTLLDRRDVGVVIALRAAERERQQRHREVLGGLPREDPVRREEGDHHDDDGDCGDGHRDRGAAVGPHGHRVQRDHRRDRDDHARVVGRDRGERPRHHGGEHGERPQRADGERRAGRSRDRHVAGADRRALSVGRRADEDDDRERARHEGVPLDRTETVLPRHGLHANDRSEPSPDRHPPGEVARVLPGEYAVTPAAGTTSRPPARGRPRRCARRS